MTKKLYRLTNDKLLLLEKITGRIDRKVELEETCSIGNKDTNKLSLYTESYDVLNTIVSHSSKTFRELNRRNKELTWDNEYDIPIEIYKRGLQTAIDVINGYVNSPIYRKQEGDDVQVAFLQELIRFRSE